MDYETAKEFFNYDPDTGRITWRVRSGKKVKIGDVAGSINGEGYMQIRFKGKGHYAHRVIWLLVTGKWPENDIDHINGIRDDNRLSNIRAATRGENNQNMKPYSNTGISGITLEKNGRYKARLHLDGKYVLNTTRKTFEDAVSAVAEAKRKYHTFNPEIVTR